jgi:hypothetical protein
MEHSAHSHLTSAFHLSHDVNVLMRHLNVQAGDKPGESLIILLGVLITL